MEKYVVVIVGSGIGGDYVAARFSLYLVRKYLYVKLIVSQEVLPTVSEEMVTLSNQVLHCGVE